MRRRFLAIGIILILIGAVLFVRSNQPEQRISSSWDEVKTEIDTLEIAYNFTAGDKVNLVISPNREWNPEPAVDDVPYPHIFVYVNITSPQGSQSAYEIAYVEFRYYSIRILTPGGFSGEYDTNEELIAEKGLVGRVMYTGEYKAKIIGVVNPGGPQMADYLTFSKEMQTTVTVYPYRDYVYGAVILIFLGIVISGFSFMRPNRRSRRR